MSDPRQLTPAERVEWAIPVCKVCGKVPLPSEFADGTYSRCGHRSADYMEHVLVVRKAAPELRNLLQRLYDERNRNCEIAVGLAERIHHERDDYGAYVRAMDELVGDEDAEVDAALAVYAGQAPEPTDDERVRVARAIYEEDMRGRFGRPGMSAGTWDEIAPDPRRPGSGSQDRYLRLADAALAARVPAGGECPVGHCRKDRRQEKANRDSARVPVHAEAGPREREILAMSDGELADLGRGERGGPFTADAELAIKEIARRHRAGADTGDEHGK